MEPSDLSKMLKLEGISSNLNSAFLHLESDVFFILGGFLKSHFKRATSLRGVGLFHTYFYPKINFLFSSAPNPQRILGR